jgi:adenylylsulfate kinase
LSENIIQHNFDIEKKDYEKKHGHKGGVIWLTGLSGSGKSTIANYTQRELFNDFNITILDGDDVRSGLNSDLSFTSEDRVENLRRVAHVANLFASRGLIVLCSFISPMNSQRAMIKKIIGEDNFHLAYINTSLKTCEARDPKGLYQKARAGEIQNFTGISSPFEEPSHSHLIINTDNKELADNAQELINYIKKNF